MTQVRLNKVLASRGIASRREADRLIEDGRVKVNGRVVTELGTRVDPERDRIEVDEQGVRQERKVYVALHKPVGYVCACRRTALSPKIVTDLVPIPERIFPVGRLDKDSSGLLILTNDGTLTFKLTHPSSGCEKEYEVRLIRPITAGAIRKLEAGVKLWGEKTLPTRVRRLGKNVVRIILREGKNRQVRRICKKVGFPPKTLKRLRIRNLWLGDLPEGRWRFLTPEEIRDLKS